MSKFMLSMGLGLAALIGLAGAGESKASTPPVKATPSLAKFSAAAESQAIGPFSTYAAAYAEMLDLENLGHDCSLPYLQPDGWYIDVD